VFEHGNGLDKVRVSLEQPNVYKLLEDVLCSMQLVSQSLRGDSQCVEENVENKGQKWFNYWKTEH
jgi:hypothetical protein